MCWLVTTTASDHLHLSLRRSPIAAGLEEGYRLIGCTENLCGRVFKVVEPLHGGSPTLSAMDAGFQWYGKASQLENILGCSGWP